MGKRDPRVDAYIARSAAFAKPILTQIRETVHEAYPDIEEGIKWGAPHFLHKGLVCAMASFKAHCRLHFWKGALIVPTRARRAEDDKGMDQLQRLTSVADLPPKKMIIAYVRTAVKLNDGAVSSPAPPMARKRATKKLPLRTPPSLAEALGRNRKAKTTFDGFSPSHRREYIEWISEAKTSETRDRRIEQALGWMAEGKSRNWKYLRK